MLSAWLLPEHIADVLPVEARRIEELRRSMLDIARSYGFELVMPPLLEHLDSLLSGTGGALDLRTFKLVDQLSGRTLGVRADTTPQVARIDAHLLNRRGVTRLCYCGPVLHTRPAAPHATREPVQFGAEIYGHAGLEADLEVQDLLLDGLAAAGLTGLVIDLGDARIVEHLLAEGGVEGEGRRALIAALAAKDGASVAAAAAGLPGPLRQALIALTTLYGDAEVLPAARDILPRHPVLAAALDDLGWLATRVVQAHPEVRISFDLADVGGHAYYTGPRFAVYAAGLADALARGGRYDAVGAIFGRNRPAVGFSVDLKTVVGFVAIGAAVPAIRAPWSDDDHLRSTVRRLRGLGESVVCALPGHGSEAEEFDCDRELIRVGDDWVVRALCTPS
jgi:ATP phosphoribosyltransferase regulatory subunit